MKKKFTEAKIKADSIDLENFSIDFIATIEVKDRHGDIVDVDSMDFIDYDKNPVVLPQHKHDELAIGKTIQHWTEIIDGKKAKVMRVKFAVDEYKLAKTYFNLYAGGFMNAVSLGFIPERGEEIDDAFVLFGSKILELSCVSIPANQLALAKQKGLYVDDIVADEKENILKNAKDLMNEAKGLLELVNQDHEENCDCNKCTGKVEASLNAEQTADEKRIESRKRAYRNIAKALRQI